MSARLLSFAAAVAGTLMLGAGGGAAAEPEYQCDDLAARGAISEYKTALYQGGEGWFFREGDFNHFYLASQTTRRFLVRLSEILQNRGVELVVLPLPPKAVMEAEHALEAVADGEVLYEPGFARAQFESLLAAMRSDGLDVVDILGYLARRGIGTDDAYFARDIHWRPEFAKISAEASAEAIRATADPAWLDTKGFATEVARTEEYKPNLSVIIRQLCESTVPYEEIAIYETAEAETSLDAFLDDGGGAAPVNVIGTSFTDEVNRFNYSGFLRQALGTDVATFAVSGGGVDQALYQWAHRGIADGTKVLVWELPYIERLEASAARLERQVIPAIAGRCADSPALVTRVDYTLDETRRFATSLPAGVRVAGQRYYVNVTLSDPALRQFTLHFQYRDGSEEIVPLVRPERVGAFADLYAELSPEIEAELASVAFEAPGTGALSGTLSICSYGTELATKVVAQN